MPDPIISLTNADVEKLRDYGRRLDRLETEINRRSARVGGGASARDMYVALTPATGIPARSLGVTGEQTPGSADCTLYRLDLLDGDDSISPQLMLIDDGTVNVNNLSSNVIDADTYVLVERDNFGVYWVLGSGAAPASATTKCIWANCRTLTSSRAEVLANDQIPAAVVLSSSPYEVMFVFAVSFQSRDNFTVCWNIADNDDFYEDYAKRTDSSCTLLTQSGAQPTDHFGVIVCGSPSGTPVPPWTGTGTGTGTASPCGPCDVVSMCVSLTNVQPSTGFGVCADCATVFEDALVILGHQYGVAPCTWGITLGLCGGFADIYVSFDQETQQIGLKIQIRNALGLVIAGSYLYYTASYAGWLCDTPITLTRDYRFNSPEGDVTVNAICSWPDTATVSPWACSPPTGTGTGSVARACCDDALPLTLCATIYDLVCPIDDVQLHYFHNIGAGPPLSGWYSALFACGSDNWQVALICDTSTGLFTLYLYINAEVRLSAQFSYLRCTPFLGEGVHLGVGGAPDNSFFVRDCASTGTGTGGGSGTQGTIPTDCCVNLLPVIMYFSADGLPCTVADLPLTNDGGGSQTWQSASIDCGGNTLLVQFFCSSGTWEYTIFVNGVGSGGTADASSCGPPFSASGTYSVAGYSGSWAVTV